jgi:hypothetical protein
VHIHFSIPVLCVWTLLPLFCLFVQAVMAVLAVALFATQRLRIPSINAGTSFTISSSDVAELELAVL